MSKLNAALAVLLIIFIACLPAIAQDSSDAAKETKSESTDSGIWEFTIGPSYVWLIAHKADITVKGRDVDGDVSYSNVFDDTNAGVVFHVEAVRKQSWGLFAGFNYIELNPDDKNTDIEFEQILGEAAALYRLIEGDLIIDGFGGLRYARMDVELDNPSGRKDQDQTKDWIDPFIGLKWKWNINNTWGTNLRADAGGFSIGSKRTFNFVGMVDFKPWQHVGFFGGYRGLYQDYSTGTGGNKFKYTGWMHGPLLGLNLSW